MVEALSLNDRLFDPMWAQQAEPGLAGLMQRHGPLIFESAQVMPPPGLEPPGLQAPCADTASEISDATLLRDDGSRVSFATEHSVSQFDMNSLVSIGEPKFLLDDLHRFRGMLASRLTAASQALTPVDEELKNGIGQVSVIMEELMAEAESVALDLFVASQNEVLMVILHGGRQPDLALGAVGKLSKLRTRTRNTRSEYLWILERLRYLSKCIEAVWDNSLDAEEQSGQSELLELSLDQINASADLLEECSDFWITLHKAELQLPDIKLERKASKSGKAGARKA